MRIPQHSPNPSPPHAMSKAYTSPTVAIPRPPSYLAAPGGKDFILGIFDECSAVAAAEGYPPREVFLARTRGMLTAEGSPMTASMFRDIKVGAPVEADHVIGDLIRRGDAAKVPVPKLRTAYTHLKAYESQRG